ncbi:hypothetical protein [Lacticaseibacillus sharpeae]|uniref:hypothetical protein n=1 Tax=Lacticaseibacillus sharpeae TaxID=1626 RepID=UPI0006D1150B|nr:hypothetical protein [Lacticaseibacillus sharpeae]
MIEATLEVEPYEVLTREQLHFGNRQGRATTYTIRREKFVRHMADLPGIPLFVWAEDWGLYPSRHKLGVIEKVERFNKKSVLVTVAR